MVTPITHGPAFPLTGRARRPTRLDTMGKPAHHLTGLAYDGRAPKGHLQCAYLILSPGRGVPAHFPAVTSTQENAKQTGQTAMLNIIKGIAIYTAAIGILVGMMLYIKAQSHRETPMWMDAGES